MRKKQDNPLQLSRAKYQRLLDRVQMQTHLAKNMKYDIDFEKKRINWKSKAQRDSFWEEVLKLYEDGDPLCKCTMMKCFTCSKPRSGESALRASLPHAPLYLIF